MVRTEDERGIHNLLPNLIVGNFCIFISMNTITMKNINILILLFLPIIIFSQSQYINGIELNGPKDFMKTGDLTWSKGGSNIFVMPSKTKMSFDLFEETCKRGSRTSEFLESGKMELQGKNRPYCLQTGNNGTTILQTMVYRDGYTYLILLSDNSPKIEDAMTQLGYMMGYMIVRVEKF